MESMEFPIISLANIRSDFDHVTKQLFEAACKWGFFIITDHGITKAAEAFALSRSFFDLPLDVKMEKMADESTIGYDGGKEFTTFAASEGILLGMPAGGVLNSTNLCSWWDEEKRRTVETFKGECYALTIAIMSGFALSLGLDRDFFTRVHEHKSPGHTLKMIKYPKLDSQPGDGQLPRLSTHTDWGSLTFVFTEQAGLEIQDPQNHWLQVPVVPGGIIVNIGDALSLWTAKALKSTLHRITWENLPHDRDRFSMAYFSQPNNNAQLSSIGDTGERVTLPFTYGEYYKVRYRLTYGARQDTKSGKKMLDDVDPDMVRLVHNLGVADAGGLKVNEVVAA